MATVGPVTRMRIGSLLLALTGLWFALQNPQSPEALDDAGFALAELLVPAPGDIQLDTVRITHLPIDDFGYTEFDRAQSLLQQLTMIRAGHLVVVASEPANDAAYNAVRVHLAALSGATQNRDGADTIDGSITRDTLATEAILFAASPPHFLRDRLPQNREALLLSPIASGTPATVVGSEAFLSRVDNAPLSLAQRSYRLLDNTFAADWLLPPTAGDPRLPSLAADTGSGPHFAFPYLPRPDSPLAWLPGVGLVTDSQTVSDRTGKIRPLARAPLPVVDSAALARAGFRPTDWLLIGDDLRALQQQGQLLRSVVLSDFAHTPYWLEAAVRAAMCALLIGFAVLLVMAKPRATLLSAAALFIVLHVAQWLLMAVHQWWLPTAAITALLLFWCALHVAQTRWLHHYQREQQLTVPLRRQLAAYQLDARDAAQVVMTLAPCPTSDHVLDLLYRAARALEQEQDFASAGKAYADIQRRADGYRDVGRRLEKLQGGKSTQTAIISPGGTLIMGPGAAPSTPGMLGRYQVLREIGRGAMGTVYLGQDPKIGRTVALKTLDYQQFAGQDLDAIRERFEREAETAGRLNHPHIVTVYDVGEEPGISYIAMDYLAGEPLSHFCTRETLLPQGKILLLMSQVAEALAYAHENGVIHRDIKPANLIYDADAETVTVTDFGIARVSDNSATRTGMIIGSPSYMSPEQVKGQKVDARSDIFSLGVCLYQLLTGELPFAGDSLAALAWQITNAKPTAMRDINPQVTTTATRIVNRALQKTADKRFENMTQFADALRRAL